MTEENKNRIIQFIRNEANNDTFINIDIDGAFIAMNEYFIPVFNIKKSDLTEAEFKEVVEVLKQYIRNNPNQFEMGDLVHENANWNSGDRDATRDWLPEDSTNPITPIDLAVAGRPWWSPIGTTKSRRKVASGGGRVKLPDGRLVVVDLALCRKITHSSRNSIHPAPFTVEQFEELKNLVPGHCRIKGCYNFYSFHNVTHPGSYGQEGHEVVGDICSFHRVYPDHHYDIMEEFGLNTPPPDNTAIERYNQQIIQKLDDFHQRAFALCERADELFAFLMSVGAENDPEATNKINQIFFPQPLPTLKEKLAGDAGDVAKKNNNQAIETQNPQIIQNWENNFTQKKTVLAELEKIWNKYNPNAPVSTPPP